MSSISKILSTYRKNNHLKQGDLVLMLKNKGITVSEKTISSWESERTEPSITTFVTICHMLGVKDIYEEILGENSYNPLSILNEEGKAKALEYVELLDMSGKYKKPVAEVVPMPIRVIRLFNLSVSAGTGNILDSDDFEEITVDSSVSEEADFAVRVNGDSMEPLFTNGQIIYVHSQNTLESGDIGIFSLNGAAYVKKYLSNKVRTHLVSINKKYDPIPITEYSDLITFGKVVQ